MILKTGVSRSTYNTTPTLGAIQGLYQTSQNQLNNISIFSPARIKDIVLDNNHPKFDLVGGANGIGAIFFEFVNRTGTDNINNNNVIFALPLIPYLKIYPLVNEIVLLMNGPNQQTGELQSNTSYFYLPPLGIWNHPHHNAYPNLLFTNLLPPSQAQDYEQVGVGSERKVTNDPTEIDLNSPTNPSQNTFVEKTNIHPLSPFAGDVIYEGRWGNSLRFGSTAKSLSQYSNNWSTSGNNGDPIVIIRNGQPKNSSSDGWIPITENINEDLSSIYLTSTQKIPFSLVNENFVSYTTPPTTPSQFVNPQIILNSDRVILNAKTDSVLISGQNSVGLSSNGSINIESTSEINIASKLTRLGNKNASQSVLKGDETVEYLKIILNELQNIAEALKVVQDWPGGAPVPNPVVLTAANSALQVFNNVYNQIDSVKSKIVKTA